MVVELCLVASSRNVGHLSWVCPGVEHIYGLVPRCGKFVILDEVIIVDHHILARLPCKVGNDTEAFPSKVGAETANPWSITILAQQYGIALLVVNLSDVAVLIVPHWLTSSGVYTSIAHIVEFSIWATYLQLHAIIAQRIFVATIEQLSDFVFVVTHIGSECPTHILVLDDIYVGCQLETSVGHGTDVTYTRTETCSHRIRNAHQHVGGFVAIEVGIQVQTVEHADVQTNVQLAHALPSQLIVAWLRDGDSTLTVIVVSTAKETKVVVGICTRVVTCCTIVNAQREVIQPRYVLQEVFLLGIPFGT